MKPTRVVAWLVALYAVQGIPMGVQRDAFTLLLSEQGASRSVIGWSMALSLPWFFKVFVAPYVDRVHVPSLGRRRTWLLALTLPAALLLAALGPAFDAGELALAAALLLALNCVVATLDVAVDGLAVDVLADRDLGFGNTAQVGGYKLGMIVGGGAALQLLRCTTWTVTFGLLAAVAVGAFVFTLLQPEPVPSSSEPPPRDAPPSPSLISLLRARLDSPAGRALLVAVLAYKAGESMSDTQLKPFLREGGMSVPDIGLVLGIYGMIASTAGSVIGGLAVRASGSLVRAVFAVATVRVFPQLGLVLLSTFGATLPRVTAITLAEHFVGGMLTTTMFAWMMAASRGRYAGTQFTLLATLEAVGKGVTGGLSGVVVDHGSDTLNFALAASLSLAFLALRPWVLALDARGAFADDGSHPGDPTIAASA